MSVKEIIAFFENVSTSNKPARSGKLLEQKYAFYSEKDVEEDESKLHKPDDNEDDAYQALIKSIIDSCDTRPLEDNGEDSIIEKVNKLELLGRKNKRRINSRRAADFLKIKTLGNTIQRLLITEETYVYYLYILTNVYIPHLEQFASTSLLTKMSSVCSSARNLYDAAEIFAETLRQRDKNVDFVISAFINSPFVFESYSQYLCHISEINGFISEAEALLKDKLVERLDKQTFANYLVSPLHRLDYYIDVLAEIKKNLKELQHQTSSTDLAMTIIQNAKTRGHFLSAVNSIKLCPLDQSHLGNYIMKDNFKITERESTIFLFEKAMVVTERAMDEEDKFAYVSYLNLNQIILDKCPEHKNTFLVSESKSEEPVSYSLTAPTSEIERNWVSAIEARLGHY